MEEGSQSVNTLVNKARSSNLELYRIIVMLLIVAHRYVVNSGLSELIQNNPLTLKSLFLFIFGMWGKTGINCFVLITGYFMCTSKISIKKISKLVLEVEFYKLVFYFIFIVMGFNTFSVISFSKALIPITGINNNSFTSCFLVFYLFIPFLNILVQNMNQKQHGYLLLLCVFAYVVIGSIPGFGIAFNYVSWFCVLFIIASYIRFLSL